MTSKERVLCAIKGERPDRPAFTMMLSLYGARLIDCSLDDYYVHVHLYVKGQQGVLEMAKPDILVSPFMLTAEVKAFGSQIIYLDKNPPNIKKPTFQADNEIMNIHFPDIDQDPSLGFIRESIRLLSTQHKDTTIAAALSSPIDLPALIMGIDLWLETLLFNRDKAQALLNRLEPYFVQWANSLLDDGADFLIMPICFCNPTIVSEEIMEQISLPFLTRVFSAGKRAYSNPSWRYQASPVSKILHYTSKHSGLCP